jgi:hypothetical protein
MPIFMRLSAHFGDWIQGTGARSSKPQWQVDTGLLYGQVQKSYRRRKLVRVKHVIWLGTGAAFKEALQALGFSGRVNTANTLRVNLTIRRGVAALARRTWATALQAPHLEAHLRLSAGVVSLRAATRQARASWFKRKPESPHGGDLHIGNEPPPWRLGEQDTGGPLDTSSRCPRPSHPG